MQMMYFFTLTLFSGLTGAQVTNSAPYCSGQFDDASNSSTHAITRVKLETLDNVTSETAYAFPHYVYYNNLPAVNLVRGQSYTLILQQSVEFSLTHGMAAWIDFDGDDVFDQSADSIAASTIDELNDIAVSFTYTFTVPADAALGQTRMRVKIFEDDDYTWIQGGVLTPPCQYSGGILDWGETEDYTINITENASLAEEVSPFKIQRNDQLIRIIGEEPQKVELYSLDGRLVALADDSAIDITGLPQGLYVIRIQSHQGIWFEEKIVR